MRGWARNMFWIQFLWAELGCRKGDCEEVEDPCWADFIYVTFLLVDWFQDSPDPNQCCQMYGSHNHTPLKDGKLRTAWCMALDVRHVFRILTYFPSWKQEKFVYSTQFWLFSSKKFWKCWNLRRISKNFDIEGEKKDSTAKKLWKFMRKLGIDVLLLWYI